VFCTVSHRRARAIRRRSEARLTRPFGLTQRRPPLRIVEPYDFHPTILAARVM